MIRLETTSGLTLSKILKEISPISFSSNKQVNRLLDGSFHVQIIGSPSKSVDGIIISSHNQAEALNELIDQGSLLVFVYLDKEYLVYIDEAVQWKRHNYAHGDKDRSYLEGKIKMLIKEEVVL
ncbi:hypothetical protein [Dehalococcoides sp.]|uniref:hypothetical protein n=1 Tax=Dehalococcoides sp. TaxID=1966486 RepID=UPI002ACB1840|nr:hypothetical protein [Dehalococcoides sp.]